MTLKVVVVLGMVAVAAGQDANGMYAMIQAEDARWVYPMELWPRTGNCSTSVDSGPCFAAIGEQYVGTDPADCSNKDPSGNNVPSAINSAKQGGPDTSGTKGYLEFPFTLEEDSLVSIHVRLHTPDSLADSFWGQVGTATQNITSMKWFAPRESLWGWHRFSPFSVGDSSVKQLCQMLPKGNNTFRLFVREPGAAVDAVNVSVPDPLGVGEHEGCSGGCRKEGLSTARFTLLNLCGPDTISDMRIFVGNLPCENLQIESQTVVACIAPAFQGINAPFTIFQGNDKIEGILRYQDVSGSSEENTTLLIAVLSGAGGFAIVACIVVYFSTSRMRNMRKMLSTAQIAEDMAEKVAKMELDQLEYLNDIENPTSTQQSFQTIVKALTYYKTYLPEALFTGWKDANETSESPSLRSMSQQGVNAPGIDGVATIVFTDIQGSTSIWESCPSAMRKSLAIHNRIIRECIREFHGYEVKTIGDAFMVAFDSVAEGVNFALGVQESLYLSNEWPTDLHASGLPHVQKASGWNGLRLRIGVNTGEVDVETDPFTSKSDYFGHTVNKAARIENACVAGAVAISEEVMEAIRNEGMRVVGDPIEVDMGQTALKGVQGQSNLSLLLPLPCSSRKNDVMEVLLKKQFSSRDSPAPVRKETATPLIEMQMFQESFEPVASATVAHVKFSFTDVINSAKEPHVCINAVICATLVSSERTEGSVLSLHSNSILIGWNTGNRCSSHQQAALRFIGLSLKTLEGNESNITGNIGIATGNVLYGKVGTRDQKFVTVIGECVEIAEEVVQISSDIGAFASATSLPGHRSVATDPGYKNIIRPVATLAVPRNEHEQVYVYQLRCSAFMKGGLMVGYHPDSGDLHDWGWGDDYKQAFKTGDTDKLVTMSTDPVILAVARRMQGPYAIQSPCVSMKDGLGI